MAMKQAEDARREAKKEKDEKKMEMIREKETEKEKEFELKERQRLEREAILARDYNSWKDPYTDANCQDSFLASMIEKILLHKVYFIQDQLTFLGRASDCSCTRM